FRSWSILICRWGTSLSNNRKKIPPAKKPIVTGAQVGNTLFSAYSSAGASKDQKEAAVIIPAANPCITAKNLSFTSLTKKTTAEPNKVHSHVKIPARNACKTGFNSMNQAIHQHSLRELLIGLRMSPDLVNLKQTRPVNAPLDLNSH